MWAILIPLLLLGLTCHIVLMGVGAMIISQCLRTGSYQRSSGMPCAASVFFALAYMADGPLLLIQIAGVLLALELLLAVVANAVIRRTGAQPRIAQPPSTRHG